MGWQGPAFKHRGWQPSASSAPAAPACSAANSQTYLYTPFTSQPTQWTVAGGTPKFNSFGFGSTNNFETSSEQLTTPATVSITAALPLHILVNCRLFGPTGGEPVESVSVVACAAALNGTGNNIGVTLNQQNAAIFFVQVTGNANSAGFNSPQIQLAANYLSECDRQFELVLYTNKSELYVGGVLQYTGPAWGGTVNQASSISVAADKGIQKNLQIGAVMLMGSGFPNSCAG